ncbi:hypothetical protein ASPBRDRAFT_202930 [Aspergillus brasiliensis CBS 101740]|uniref:Peptidase S8/S53 domain-containing protein n=1 Tax=Aspergillus brasiliensis (strain CBS 101740 / IMI 381727 / IBT 21946) TaxID=767769 RepID=A0A1L9V2E5_ASPBC|nr:hypothetical protein ASPBRDRAFT_202930 [Aspergillus brasiliensis CBS 101740]
MSHDQDDDMLDFSDDDGHDKAFNHGTSADQVQAHFEHLMSDIESLWDREVVSKQREDPIRYEIRRRVQEFKYIENVTLGQDTLLHLLALKPGTTIWLRHLTGNVIHHRPKLVGALNKQGHSSLYVAIRQRNPAYLDGLKTVAKQFQQKPELRERIRASLEEECLKKGDTFLHEAMSCQVLTTDYKMLLIEIAPSKAFHLLGSQGFTPLHHAVSYDNCSIGQDQVVELLLDKSPDSAVGLPASNGLSAYQWHQKSRNNNGTPSLHTAGQQMANTRVGTVSQSHRDTGAIKLAKDFSSGISKDAADRVRQVLKLWYLRHRTPIQVLDHLNGDDNDNRAFWFDYGSSPANNYMPTSRAFRKAFSDIVFEPTLKYVAFPDVSVDLNAETDKTLREDKTIIGRKDMIFFFNWLREQQVERIFKVCVEDLNNPHTDEAIEQALAGFQIEQLDWQKIDLCPKCILRVGDKIETLHLQWSGSNIALRGWSEPAGLAQLPNLRNIIIQRRKETDSPTRERENEEEFRDRFEEAWKMRGANHVERPMPSIKWVPHYTSYTTEAIGEGSATSQDIRSNNAWIKCLQNFKAQLPRSVTVAPHLGGKDLAGPIRLGLIDDGVDVAHPDLNSYKFTGASFYPYNDNERVWPYWNSTSGHGTVMARMIHLIAPNVRLHICRLETQYTASDQRVQVVPESAVQAINAAIDRKVHILCISWTIPRPKETQLQQAFIDAITRAIKNNILVFCSGSDQGQRADETYPLNCASGVFRIGAAKDSGEICDYVADQEKLDFAFPGHEVLIKNPAAFDEIKRFSSHTGSSVATALASGFAALIMECVRIGCAHELRKRGDRQLPGNDWQKIHTRDVMAGAFRIIRAMENTTGKYVAVEKVFTNATKALEGEDDYGKCVKISQFVQQLLQTSLE